jgi:hypothetical protein
MLQKQLLYVYKMSFQIQQSGYNINVTILDTQISTKIKKLVYHVLHYIQGTELKNTR